VGKARRSSGRGGGWTQRAEDKFIETLAESANVTKSAAEAGVSPSSAYRRRGRDASFRARWGEALATGYAALEMAMLERALHGRPKEVKVGGESRIIQEYDDRIALALLKMHRETVRELEAGVDGEEVDEAAERILMRLQRLRAQLTDGVELKRGIDRLALLRAALRARRA
jgi:hypothetical protein